MTDSAAMTTSVDELQNQVKELQREREEWQRSKEYLENQRLKELQAENEKLREQGSSEKSGEDSDLKFELEEVKVIINLQEEMKALRELLDVQKAQISTLKEEKLDGEQDGTEENGDDKSDAAEVQDWESTEISNEVEEEDSEDSSSWREKYKQMRARYSQLENDRALGEWALRNRITSDSLRYNRRLIHWKKVHQEQQESIEKAAQEHERQSQQLRKQLHASAASVLQHTLRDLSTSQKRVKELEAQLAKATKISKAGALGEPSSPRRMSILQFYKDRNMK